MRIIKLGFISIIFFAFVITGISLFFPSHVRISKAIDISAAKMVVLEQLNNPVNWKKWYPGADTLDLFMADGKAIGITTGHLRGLVITEANDSAVLTANTGNSRSGESGWNVFAGSAPNSVTVQWYMDFHLHWYPWEKFSSLLLEPRNGPQMEKGLAQLKALLEK